MGLPIQAGLNTWLQNRGRRISFSFGIDEERFPDACIQFEGIGQGSTSAGHIWNFIDSMIINKYKKHVETLTLTCPQSFIVIHKTLDSFVDDRKLWVPGDTNITISSRIKIC